MINLVSSSEKKKKERKKERKEERKKKRQNRGKVGRCLAKVETADTAHRRGEGGGIRHPHNSGTKGRWAERSGGSVVTKKKKKKTKKKKKKKKTKPLARERDVSERRGEASRVSPKGEW